MATYNKKNADANPGGPLFSSDRLSVLLAMKTLNACGAFRGVFCQVKVYNAPYVVIQIDPNC